MKRMLLDANDFIRGDESDGGRHSKDIKYEAGNLPKVGAAVAQHPFTAGAWSAVLQSYKVGLFLRRGHLANLTDLPHNQQST